MTTSKIYTSSDTGAPVLNGGVVGTLNAVLLACLVNGYGDKPGLGWTMPFSEPGSNTSVFKNDTVKGTGCHLRVQDNGQISSGFNNYYNLRMYASMNSPHTGIDPLPISTYSEGFKYGTSTNIAVKWILIGDNRGFYFIVFPYTGVSIENALVFYAGDVISLVPSYNRLYGLFGNKKDVSLFGTLENEFLNVSYATKSSMINRNPVTMKIGSIPAKLFHTFKFDDDLAASAQNVGTFKSIIPAINNVPYCVDNCISIEGPTVVAKLPGLLAPMYKGSSSNSLSMFPAKYFMYNGTTYLQLALVASTSTPQDHTPFIMLHIGSGFRP